jgi:hypothetical protein
MIRSVQVGAVGVALFVGLLVSYYVSAIAGPIVGLVALAIASNPRELFREMTASKAMHLAGLMLSVGIGWWVATEFDSPLSGLGVGAVLLAVAFTPLPTLAAIVHFVVTVLQSAVDLGNTLKRKLDPTFSDDSIRVTEHFCDDQGIRIELHNLNSTVADRQRVASFADAFMTEMLHQRPGHTPTEESIPETHAEIAPRSDVRGDTRRLVPVS